MCQQIITACESAHHHYNIKLFLAEVINAHTSVFYYQHDPVQENTLLRMRSIEGILWYKLLMKELNTFWLLFANILTEQQAQKYI